MLSLLIHFKSLLKHQDGEAQLSTDKVCAANSPRKGYHWIFSIKPCGSKQNLLPGYATTGKRCCLLFFLSFVLLLFFVSIKATAAYAYQKPESCLALQIKEWIQIHCLGICVKSLHLSCSYITDFLVFTGGSFLFLLVFKPQARGVGGA